MKHVIPLAILGLLLTLSTSGLQAGPGEVFSIHGWYPLSEIQIGHLVDIRGKGKRFVGTGDLVLEDGTRYELTVKKKIRRNFDEYRIKAVRIRELPRKLRPRFNLKLRTYPELSTVIFAKMVWFLPGDEKQRVKDPAAIRFGAHAPETHSLSGSIVAPDVTASPGQPKTVYLMDLGFNELDRDVDGNNTFDFTVGTGSSCQVVVEFSGGQLLVALAPEIVSDRQVEVSLASELAANLIVATEGLPETLEPENISRPLTELLSDAEEAVARFEKFREDRFKNRQADRLTEAVRAITLDRLNQGSFVDFKDLGPTSLRAYGGGLDVDDVRSLASLLSEPKTPYNPHFIFSRFNRKGEADFGMSNLDTRRWDLVGSWGGLPHGVPGGKKVVYVAPVTLADPETAYPEALGIYVKTLASRDEPILLTPGWMDCWSPKLSPDEKKIVFSARQSQQTVYALTVEGREDLKPFVYNLVVMNVDGTNLQLLTSDAHASVLANNIHGNVYPSWKPDGESLVFTHRYFAGSDPDSTQLFEDRIETVRADGTGREVLLDGDISGYRNPNFPSWSPDGRRLVIECTPPGGVGDTDSEIVILEESGGALYADKLTDNGATDSQPAWSYDGRFVIFTSDRLGELGTLTTDLFPIYVADSYTGEIVESLGDFTDAGWYGTPRFLAVEVILLALPEVDPDQDGEAEVPAGQSDPRTTGSHKSNSLHRVILPVANSIGMSFATTSWFGP